MNIKAARKMVEWAIKHNCTLHIEDLKVLREFLSDDQKPKKRGPKPFSSKSLEENKKMLDAVEDYWLLREKTGISAWKAKQEITAKYDIKSDRTIDNWLHKSWMLPYRIPPSRRLELKKSVRLVEEAVSKESLRKQRAKTKELEEKRKRLLEKRKREW
jgi:hypothetical protein